MNGNLVKKTYTLTGNANAALLLMRILYWLPKARVKHDGQLWIAKSYEDWSEETGLTVRQLQAAVNLLRNKNLITTSRHLFANRNVLHFRAGVRLKAIDETPEKGDTGDTHCGFPEPTQSGMFYEHGVTTGSYNKEKTDVILTDHVKAPPSSMGEDFPEGSHDKEVDMKPGEGKTIAEIMAESQSKGQSNPHKPNTVSHLEFVWKENCPGYSKPLTLAEKGQMKHFINACPKGRTEDVLRAVLADWVGFAKQVEQDAGAKSLPSKPHLGFLLKHMGVAVNYALAKEASPVVPKSKIKIVHAVQSTAQAASAQAKKPSYDEMMAILNDEDE